MNLANSSYMLFADNNSPVNYTYWVYNGGYSLLASGVVAANASGAVPSLTFQVGYSTGNFSIVIVATNNCSSSPVADFNFTGDYLTGLLTRIQYNATSPIETSGYNRQLTNNGITVVLDCNRNNHSVGVSTNTSSALIVDSTSNITGSFSICSWVLYDNSVVNAVFTSSTTFRVNATDFYFSTFNQQIQGEFGVNDVDDFDSSTVLPAANIWIHLAITVNTITNGVVIYYNGVQTYALTTPTYGGISPVMLFNIQNLGSGLDGSMDDTRYYSGVLTQQQVLSIYGATLGSANCTVVDYLTGLLTRIQYNSSSPMETSGNNRGLTNSGITVVQDSNRKNHYVGVSANINSGLIVDSTSNITGSFSICTWVLYVSGTANSVFTGSTTFRTNPTDFYFSTQNQFFEGEFGETGSNDFASPAILPIVNTWVHLVVTVNTTTNGVVMYYNGMEVYSLTTTTYGGMSPVMLFNIQSMGNGLAGRMDDTRYYTDVLTAAQVAAIYTAS